MKLEAYITDLLYRYDCVIVPNFGGFIANTKSAQIKSNNFSPPYKQITFNSLLQNNDGLLANYIAQVDKMPYETAINFINFEVQEWVDKLLNEDLDLDGLGSLFLANDRIQFEPESQVNYLTSSFGLNKFTSSEVARKELVGIFEKVTPVLENKRETYLEQVETIEEKAPIYLSTAKRNKTPNFIKYAAIFLLTASILGVGGKMYQDNLEQKQVADIKKNQEIREAEIQTATFVIDAPLPTITLNTVVKKEKYHIIAGAFRYKKNATKKVNQLIKQGYNAKVVGKNKWNLTQVAFSSFTELTKANNALVNIKNNVANDAWLLVKENN